MKQADSECAPRFKLERNDPGYPRLLTLTPDPPDVIFGIGDHTALTPGLAVIGSRSATPYGLSIAKRFASWAGGAGIPVISGAARGCDQAAHRGALGSGGRTVAVLGCGADICYPATAHDLLCSIQQRGAVISELDWGTRPQRWTFARRNRIIAGLAVAVLVVEARLPSGTFSTADAALEAGRDVFAVPGSIYAPECRGSNRLICQGATPITDVSELAAALRPYLSDIAQPESETPTDETSHCTDRVISALRTNPARPDDLARSLDMDIIELMRRIAHLEHTGQCVRYPDGRYGSLGKTAQEGDVQS